jgi:hypothetical protein
MRIFSWLKYRRAVRRRLYEVTKRSTAEQYQRLVLNNCDCDKCRCEAAQKLDRVTRENDARLGGYALL